jgi:Xaa-Pro aminopeptidase
MKSYGKALSLLSALVFALSPFSFVTGAHAAGDYYDEPGVRLLNQPVVEYRARRARLMNEVKDGVVVVLGNVEEDNGVEARYRQNNWMAYLTGVRTPGASLLLVPPGLASLNGAREIIFIPPRNLQEERWTGIQLAPGEETARGFGVERVMPTRGTAPVVSNQAQTSADNNLMLRLKEAAQLPAFKNGQGASAMKVYTVAPRNMRNGYVREYQFVEELKKELPGVEVITGDRSLVRVVGEMRKAKSAAELVLLQKAIDITGEAQRDIARNLKPGMYEYEVQAILEAAFMRGGAERPGFPSIVGSGLFSTILHYSENHKRIDAGDTVVCDIGAEYSLYTADITRTYPASGKFTERQRAIYQLVLDTQAAAAAHWKPGMTMADLNRFAREFMSKSPLRAKDADGKEYSMDHFFIHGLGHYVGMDVHDTGDYARPLQPGEAFTIEPGIYIPTEQLGVRIEDDYVITPEQTVRKMSEKIPSSIVEIERLMSGRRS